MSEAKDQINAVIAELGLEFKFTFVPFSKSRHAKPAKTPSDLTLNWLVNIVRRTGKDGEDRYRFIETDYSQGVGHVPGKAYPNRNCIAEFERVKGAVETGKYSDASQSGGLHFNAKIPPPEAYDVLYCLANDASAIDYRNYEEWASDFGYDPDSRKGEAVYQACLKIALELRALIGDEAINKIRDAQL